MAKSDAIVDDELRTEYDFSGGVRGKHHKVLREDGYIVRVSTTMMAQLLSVASPAREWSRLNRMFTSTFRIHRPSIRHSAL